ncbi:MAG: ATP-binding protein [Clostridia bacterium]|nr:ATP-binding protein [Clostridia bacterium]
MQEIKRDRYLHQLIDRKENGLIKIITGIRRCGKSYLLFTLYYKYLKSLGVDDDHIIRIALDDDDNKQYRNADSLSAYLKSRIGDDAEVYYVLLDEVQFVITDEELQKNEPLRIYGILNGLLRRNNVDVYVTGSNSRFLSTDVMTEFRGRGDEVRVYPLSFAEFFSVYDGDKYEAFTEYSTYGGLPLVLTKKRETDKVKYLRDNLNETYLKDVAERQNLRGDVVMSTLVEILASAVGSLTNPLKLANTFRSSGLQTNENTISGYITYLANAFIINCAKRYDVKGKKYISSPYKYYFSDIGIRNAALNFRQQERTHIMENIIYNELLVRGYNVDVGIVSYTGKTADGKRTTIHSEVDFVCNLASKRYYIQSAFAIPDADKMNQETASLDRIDDSFKKIIVVGDLIKPWTNERGYLIISIYDFLLNADSMNL